MALHVSDAKNETIFSLFSSSFLRLEQLVFLTALVSLSLANIRHVLDMWWSHDIFYLKNWSIVNGNPFLFGKFWLALFWMFIPFLKCVLEPIMVPLNFQPCPLFFVSISNHNPSLGNPTHSDLSSLKRCVVTWQAVLLKSHRSLSNGSFGWKHEIILDTKLHLPVGCNTL